MTQCTIHEKIAQLTTFLAKGVLPVFFSRERRATKIEIMMRAKKMEIKMKLHVYEPVRSFAFPTI